MSRTEIPLSKTKVALLLLFPIIITIIGALLYFNPESLISAKDNDIEKMKIFGLAGAIIGLIGTILLVRKWFIKNTGFIIDQSGIKDLSNASYTGLVEWKDITKIEAKKVGPIKLIILHTNDPEKYINQAKKTAVRQLRKNLAFYGSPLMIVSTRLSIKYDDLVTLLNNEFRQVRA